MPAPTPEVDVASAIVTAGLGTLGTTLFYGPERGLNARGVTSGTATYCLASGGVKPAPFADGGAGTYLAEFSVQVLVRSSPDAYAGGLTQVRALRDALNFVSIAGYINVAVRESDPLYLGQDESGRHRWTINLDLLRKV